jgi:purine nucleosidase
MKIAHKCLVAAMVLWLCPAMNMLAKAQQSGAAGGSEKRRVIIDQDCAGPGGTDMQAVLAIVQSPSVHVLGITVMTGDAWLAEEVQHTLRLMEIIGRSDIPVVPGAAFPLVNTKEYVERWEKLYGKVVYQGAWNYGSGGHAVHGPWEIPTLPEGAPTTKAATEDAAHFLIRMVHQYPHEITIYAGGPLTNLALAQAIDADFASLAKELIVMGGSLAPVTDDPEFTTTPRREFNFWIDPEAASRVLHSAWPRIVVTTVDISVKTQMSKELIAQIAKAQTPAAQYTAKYATPGYLWDELAAVAWLDPSIITRTHRTYMDVSIDHGVSYGDTVIWTENTRPHLGEREVEVQDDLDKQKFYDEFVQLITGATPQARK